MTVSTVPYPFPARAHMDGPSGGWFGACTSQPPTWGSNSLKGWSALLASTLKRLHGWRSTEGNTRRLSGRPMAVQKGPSWVSPLGPPHRSSFARVSLIPGSELRRPGHLELRGAPVSPGAPPDRCPRRLRERPGGINTVSGGVVLGRPTAGGKGPKFTSAALQLRRLQTVTSSWTHAGRHGAAWWASRELVAGHCPAKPPCTTGQAAGDQRSRDPRVRPRFAVSAAPRRRPGWNGRHLEGCGAASRTTSLPRVIENPL